MESVVRVHVVDRGIRDLAPSFVGDWFGSNLDGPVGCCRAVMDMRNATDFAAVNAIALEIPKRAVEPRSHQLVTIGPEYIQADTRSWINLPTPSDDLFEADTQGFNEWSAGVMLPERKQIAEDVLAVGAAVDLVAMQRVRVLKQALAHKLEIRHGPVVSKNPAAVSEGMSVSQQRRADRSAAHMRDHSLGINPRRRLAKMLTVIGGPSLLLDVGNAVGICGQTPAVDVAIPRHVLTALCHQGVLCQHQGTLDLGRLVRAKAIQATHLSDSLFRDVPTDSTDRKWISEARSDQGQERA